MKYVASRLAQLVLVLLIVSFLAFLLIRALPGDPVLAVTGCPESATQSPACADKIEEARADLRLDKSVPVAYVGWLGDLLPPDVDLGYSYTSNTEVSEIVSFALPRTARLMAYSVIVALVLAIPLGVLAAHRAGGWVDKAISTTSFGLIAVPNFVLAVVLPYLFNVFGWLEDHRRVVDPDAGWSNHLKSHVLPVLSLSLGLVAVFARLLRTDMVTTLSEDFIGMAKAKGMPVWRILFQHALRPSSFTLLTVVGLNIGQLLGGAVIIEFIFDINGMGQQLALAIGASNYVFLQTGIVIVAALFVTLNVLVDILYGVLDPRVRDARR